MVSRRLREQRWEHELRPDAHYSPDMSTKLAALLDAALMEGAAARPGPRAYALPEEAVEHVLRRYAA
jgi:hypothetical protein